jgi:hypothetical protein
MPVAEQIEAAVRKVHDQRSFLRDRLAGALEWPVSRDGFLLNGSSTA